MLASRHFRIARTEEDDWFDPILDADTQLFVDPFLVFKEEQEFWQNAHETIVEHFNKAFTLIAEGNLDPATTAYKKALALLIFREPKEFCLGYTSLGTAGAGSGRGFALSIANAIADAIKRGLKHPRHFEELGVLNEGIGSDRISDITCTVLKRALVTYTQTIAKRHNIDCETHRIYAAAFDDRRIRWETPAVLVPTNPVTGGPLLLVPQRFLRDLPVLNAYDWWNAFENEQLRQDVNYELMGKIDKKSIVAIARSNPEAVRRWTEEKEVAPAAPYDFATDPRGVWSWDVNAQSFVQRNALNLPAPTTEAEFVALIEQIINQFRLFVQDQGGWELLWNTGHREEKPESAAQLLFRGIAQHYCHANNISLEREVELGRGSVDFKFSNGYAQRAHLEVKKVHNGKFWDGLDKQLVTYMLSDEVQNGWLMAIRYRDNERSDQRVKELPDRTGECAERTGLNIRYTLIDGRPPLSASKL